MSEMPPQDPASPPANPTAALFDPPPVPAEPPPTEHRVMGMLCHLLALCALVGIPFGHILGPLIMWLVKKQEVPFVDDQGKESLNFQITLTILAVSITVLAIVIAFIPLLGWLVSCLLWLLGVAVAIAAIVFVILAGIAANNGQYYRYPISMRLIK